MKKELKKIVKWEVFVVVLLIIFILGSIFFLRYWIGQPLLYEQEAYYHLNQVQNYFNCEISVLELNPLEGVVALFTFIVPLSTLDKFLFLFTSILAMLTYFFYRSISKRLKINPVANFIFLIILIISPAFLLTFSTLSNYAMITFITVLGFFFLSSERKWVNYLAAPIFFIIPLFDTLSAVVVLLLLFNFYFLKEGKFDVGGIVEKSEKQKKETKKAIEPVTKFGPFPVTVVLLIVSMLISYIQLGRSWFSAPELANNFWQNLFSDFGGLGGVSVFVIILAIFGLYSIWNKKETYFLYLLLLILIPSYYLNNQTIYLLCFVTAILAANYIYWLIEKRWTLTDIKNFTILLLVLGMVFSSLTYIDRVTDYPPYQETVSSLIWLEEQALDDYSSEEINSIMTLSIPENNYYVEYFTSLKSFQGINYQQLEPGLKVKIDEHLTNQDVIHGKDIFYITYPPLLFPVLVNNQVQYIYVDPDTKETFSDEQGLLFALRNERFKLIHSDESFEVWEFELEGEI